MDNIKSQIDRLEELSEEELSTLQSTITSEFEALTETDLTPQSVDTMDELATMLDSVRGEESRREAQLEELATRAAQASARVTGTEEEAPVDDMPTEDEESDEDEDDEDEVVVASAETEDEVAPVSEETVTEPVTEASVEEVVEPEAPAEAEAAVIEEENAPVEAEASAEEVTEAPETTEAEAPAEAEAASETEEAVAETEADSEASAEEVAEVETPEETEASVSEESTIESNETQEEAHTVTASAEEAVVEAPAGRRPVAQEPVAPSVAITAGADIPGISAGSTITDMSQVAEAFSDRLHTLSRANGGDGEQHTVAVFSTEYSEDRYLRGNADENWNKISAAVEEHNALVASGGYGTPVPVRYDIYGFGTDARPVKDSLPKFQANRGGVRYVVPPQLSEYADATGVWTEALDITAASNNGTDDTLKNYLVVNGATEATAKLDAVTLQLQIGNLLDRAYPELVARHNQLALIQHAREAELNTLAKIEAASTAVTSGTIIGAARDFLVTVKRAAAAYRSRHRIAPDTRLEAIIPMWVYDAMAADLTLNMPGDGNLAVSQAEIQGMLATSNVSMTGSYDLNVFGAQAAGAMSEFPDTFKWYLFSEGTFLFLDGGSLDLGIVRDSGLVGTNDYRMFVETFEGVAKVGIESLAITQTINVNGVAAALRDTTGGLAAAAVEA